MMPIVLGAVFFFAAGYLGVLLAESIVHRLQPFDDGPTPQSPPTALMLAACAAIGAVVTSHASSPAQVGFVAILCVALTGIFYVDLKTGIVPDIFTLGPIAIILAVALLQRDWILLISGIIPVIPFALAAYLSKGRGMGWGDVKLVALGGLALGAQAATLAFAVACIAAVLIAFAKRRTSQPIAFAPYLAGAIALAVPVSALL